MNKLARKLSVFALSSVILLANSPIKAGMFAEGQTYDLGEVGTVKIENYHSLGDSVESFDILGFHCKIIIYQNGYAVDFTNNITGSTFSYRRVNGPGQLPASALILKDISDEILRRNKNPFVKEIPRSTQNRDKKRKTNFVAEKKPKKVNQPEYRTITYKLPNGKKHDYQNGHCACETPAPGPANTIKVSIEDRAQPLCYYPCLKCKRPIRQTNANNRCCNWKAYCRECGHPTEFYMIPGTGDKYILRCCSRYPFEIHEIEYASTAEFNAAMAHGQIKML